MGGDLEPSLDSLCLCPAQLIREVLCSSWAITPPTAMQGSDQTNRNDVNHMSVYGKE